MYSVRRANVTIAIVVALASLNAALAFLVPMPASWHDSWALFYIPLAMTILFTWFHFGADALFLMTLGAYKAGFKRAYVVICVSIALLACGTLQVPIIEAFNWWGRAWVTYGGIGIPFILAGLAAYFGTRALAKLVGAQTILTRAVVAVPATLVLAALTALLPHVSTNTPETSYEVGVAVLSWSAFAYLAAVIILARVRAHIGGHYTHAMAWLLVAFMASCGAMVLATVATLVSNKNQDGWSVAIYIDGLIAGIAYLRAGLIFTKANEY